MDRLKISRETKESVNRELISLRYPPMKEVICDESECTLYKNEYEKACILISSGRLFKV